MICLPRRCRRPGEAFGRWQPAGLTDQPIWSSTNDNTWTYTFKELPVFDEDGHAIVYTAEETLPEHYSMTGKAVTATSYNLGDYAEIEEVTTCAPKDFKLIRELNLGVVFIKPTSGDDTIVWTQRVPTAGEQDVLEAKAHEYFGQHKNIQWASGLPYEYTNPQHKDRKATITMTDDGIHLRFSHSSTWAQFAYGRYNATYTSGSTDFTNKLLKASIPGTKSMANREMTKDDIYSFSIAAESGTPMPKETNVQNNASGAFSFGPIYFTKADMADAIKEKPAENETTATMDFTYTITEVVPQEPAEGIVYDKSSYTVKYTMTYTYATGDIAISGPAITKGNETVNAVAFVNAEDTDFVFTKQWLNGSQVEDTWPTDASGNELPITVTLKRKLEDHEGEEDPYDDSFEVTYTLSPNSIPGGDANPPSADDSEDDIQEYETELPLSDSIQDNATYPIEQIGEGFRFKISNLEKYGVLNDGRGEWVYMMTEARLDGYNAPIYRESDESQQNAAVAKNGYVIVNAMTTVPLPSTGGPGTNLLYLLGGMMIMLAGAGLILLNRRKREG